MIAAVCPDPVRVVSPLWSGDTRSTAGCLRAVGVGIDPVHARSDGDPADAVIVHGVGLDGLRAPAGPLDAGNSGTTLRLLAGLLAGGGGRFVLDGDQSLRRRPMDRVVAPLRAMGVAAEARDGRYPPVTVVGGPVRAIDYRLPVASAQVKSCVLLAGLHAEGTTVVVEAVPSRDHTERLLRMAGADLRVEAGRVLLQGRPQLGLDEVRVPGDPSSAAFLAAAAALLPGSELTVPEVGLNPSRLGFYEALRRMGAVVTTDAGETAAEPAGTLHVAWAPLQGIRIAARDVPLLIDEVPLLALVATAAEGDTVVEGVAELRHKESDRLTAIVDIVGALGGKAEVAGDSLRILPCPLRGGLVRSRGDHRLAMLGAVAGLASREGVTVEDFEAADVSFPGFERTLEEVLQS